LTWQRWVDGLLPVALVVPDRFGSSSCSGAATGASSRLAPTTGQARESAQSATRFKCVGCGLGMTISPRYGRPRPTPLMRTWKRLDGTSGPGRHPATGRSSSSSGASGRICAVGCIRPAAGCPSARPATSSTILTGGRPSRSPRSGPMGTALGALPCESGRGEWEDAPRLPWREEGVA